jgi:hypothetical protein
MAPNSISCSQNKRGIKEMNINIEEEEYVLNITKDVYVVLSFIHN